MHSRTPIHEYLRAAREARGEDLASLAARAGMREGTMRAVDEGRFHELPSGIYGRAAIRAYATAVGRDPAEVLVACEPLLRPMDDPVTRLAYLHGVRHQAPAKAASSAAHLTAGSPAAPDSIAARHALRSMAAAGIDAVLVVTALLAVVAATTMYCGLPPSALGRNSAPGFGVMGIVLALTYFACVGGIAGATIGEQLVHAATPVPGRIVLRDVIGRALHCATIDVRTIIDAGALVAAWALRPHGRLHSSASPTETTVS